MSDQIGFGSQPAAAPAAQPAATTPAQGVQSFSPGASNSPAGATAPVQAGSITVPEKFRNADGTLNSAAMLQSYTELERRLGAGGQPQPAQGGQPPAMTPSALQPKGQEAPTALQPQEMRAVAQEWMANGGNFTQQTYAALQQRGVDPSGLSRMFQGEKAIGDARSAQVFSAVGGKESFDAMKAWGAANLTDGEKHAFTVAVNGPVELALMAVQNLKSRFEAANGAGGNILSGGNTGGMNIQGTGYRSHAEMVTAINDPRYSTDPAYRTDVEQKIIRSTFA
jgi:hypothetical protein